MMLSDKLFFAAMIIIPLLIMVAAGYALRYEKLDIIPVAVVDEDSSGYSALLLERLSKKEGLGLYIINRKEAMSMLEGSRAEQVFVIREGFGLAVKSGEANGLIEMISLPSSSSAGVTREIVAGEAMRLVTVNMAANNVTDQYKKLEIEMAGEFRDEVTAYADALWEPKPLMTIEYKELKSGIVSTVSHAALPASSATSAGLITAFILFYMLFSSGWLIEERANGTIKRLGVAKGGIAVSFKGSVLALYAAGMLQIAMFIIVQRVFFGITLFTGIFSYTVLFAYLLAVISISLFLSAALKTSAQLQAGAPVIALLSGFAGGCFWNFVEMPEKIRTISLFTPQGWALRGINGLLLNPTDGAAAIIPTLVLLATALILLPLSYIIMKIDR